MKRTVTKIAIGPKRVTADVSQNSPVGIPHYVETTKAITPAMVNVRDHAWAGESIRQPQKQAEMRKKHQSIMHDHKKSRTPEGRPLLPPPMFHSTPLLVLHRLSSNLLEPSSAHLSFNQSWSSLSPLTWVGAMPVPSCPWALPIQGGNPSVIGPLLPSVPAPAVNFSEDHIKQIFSFACEGRHLKERITREFIRLSSQEVLFHTQVQSTGHESLAGRQQPSDNNLQKRKTRLWRKSSTRRVRRG